MAKKPNPDGPIGNPVAAAVAADKVKLAERRKKGGAKKKGGGEGDQPEAKAVTDCKEPTIISKPCPPNFDQFADQLKLWTKEWDKWFPCVNERLQGTCCAMVGPELWPGPREALCDAVKAVTKQWYDWGVYVQELVNHCGNPSHVPPPPPPPYI